MTEWPILTLQIPNPFFEGRNRVYVIPSDPLTLIDTGIATERAFDSLVQGLEQHGISILDVGRVILTHKHIDHIGNAWRIQQETGAEILIHEREMQAVSDVDPDGRKYFDLVKDRLVEWKVPEDAIPPQDSSGLTWEIQSATPTGLVDGQRIDLSCGQLEVVHTPGHTKGSICLKYGRRFLSGDHVLPDITPNIGGGDMRQRGLLKHYLPSLQRTVDLAADIDQVFPGHGEPFDYLEQRCHEILEHHRQRLEEAVGILEREGPLQVYEMARILFGEMRDFHVVLGCAEAQAHLEFLMDEGRVASELGEYSLV